MVDDVVDEEQLASQKRAATRPQVEQEHGPKSRLPYVSKPEAFSITGEGLRVKAGGTDPVGPTPRMYRSKQGKLVDAKGKEIGYDPAYATPMQRLARFPATGKYILDDPSVAAGVAGASADWLTGTGLPAVMRTATRNIMGPGKRAAKSFGRGTRQTPVKVQERMDTIIDDVWEQSTEDEKFVALYDMKQALYRASRDPQLRLGQKGDRGLGQGGWERLTAPQNERQMKVIHSTYIHANRIRAMQEMLEQWGHGGQRELHDISGMIYQRAQDLARTLQHGSRSQFMAEFTDFEQDDTAQKLRGDLSGG